MRLFVVFLLLFSSAWSQALPYEYRLFLDFLKTRDVELAERIIKDYPDAVFLDDLKVLTARELEKRGQTDRAVGLLKEVNPKRLRDDLRSTYRELWLSLNLDVKEAFLKNPVIFADFAGRLTLSPEEAQRTARELFDRRLYKAVVSLYEKNPHPQVCALYGASLHHLKSPDALKTLLGCERDTVRDEYLLRIYLSSGDYTRAQELVDQSPRLGVLGGRMLLHRGEYEKAIDFLSKAPDSYDKHFNLGLINFILGKYENAVKHFKQSLEYASDPYQTSQSNFWLSKSYSSLSVYELASEHLLRSSNGEGFYSLMSRVHLREPIVHRGISRVMGSDFPKTANIIKAIYEEGLPYYARLEAFKRIKDITPSDVKTIAKSSLTLF